MPNGRPVEERKSEAEGMLFNVKRAYFGEELPWSCATNGIAAGGGRCWSMVGYTWLK
jgi:hypothetical protein